MRLRGALFLAVCLVAAGCSRPSVVGKWVVDPASIPASGAFGGDVAKQLTQGVSLEFKPDNTFSFTMMYSFEGTYEVSGHTVTMKLTKAAGKDVATMKTGGANPGADAIQATLSDDGKTLTVTGSASMGGNAGQTVKYVRATG